MPFVPSSPTRLYTFRRTRSLRPGPGNQDSHEADTSGRIAKFRKSQPKANTSETTERPEGQNGRLEQTESEKKIQSNSSSSSQELNVQDVQVAEALQSIEHKSEKLREQSKQQSASPTGSKLRYSFFENTSDSEYSVDDEDSQIVVGRASSVRVSKPVIIQHKHNKKSQVTGSSRLQQDHISEESSPRSERNPTLQQTSPPRMVEEESEREAEPITAHFHPQAALFTEVDDKDGRYMSSFEEESKALPTGSTFNSVHPTIISSSSTEPKESEVSSRGINRTMSSSLPLPGKGLSRRVTIRPSDILTKDNKRRTSFRESIVTTPYPKRRDDESDSIESNASKDASAGSSPSTFKPTSQAKGKSKELTSSTIQPILTPSMGEKDRFPSPERSETLFLDLTLSRHSLARTTLEIQIANKSTFDDECLFTQIRAAYTKQLLGARRWPFTLLRRIGYVTVPSDASSDFNNIDFMKHLHAPRLGRRRKAWVIWLRNNNSRTPARTAALVPPTAAHLRQLQVLDDLTRPRKLSLTTIFGGQHRRGSRGNDNKSHHTEKNPVAGVDDHPMNKRHSSVASDASTAGSFDFVYTSPVGGPRLSFLNLPPQQKGGVSPVAAASPVRSFFWPNNPSSALSTSPSLRHASENVGSRIVTASFQHEYRFGSIALLTLLVVVQAVVATLVWVVFGVPGTRPGMDGRGREGFVKSDWRVDAKRRVGTGIIIGLVVFLMGCLVEGGLIWGSWLLL